MTGREAMSLPAAGRLWLLASLAVAAAPQLLRTPHWFAVLCLLLMGWRLGTDLRRWPLPGTMLRLALTLAGTAAVLLGYHTLFGRDAGLALLTLMLCLKLLEVRRQRDALLAVFMGYFLIAGDFLYDQSLPAGGYLFAAVLLLTTALVALNHPGGNRTYSRVYLRQAGALLAQSLPVMLVLFVLFPRIPGPLWGLPKDAFAGRTGLSDHMTLGNITDLAESDAVAFRVRFDGTIPPASRLYWRGPVLWLTNGRRWDPLFRVAPAWYRLPPRLDRVTATVGYTITLEASGQPWLLALDVPLAAPRGATLTDDDMLQLPDKLDERRRYHLRSALGYRWRAADPAVLRLALALPRNANLHTVALGRQWASLPPARRVARALSYFRDQPFFYTRHPPPLGPDAMDDFLFVTRRGFCEHYAAAFVTLMRAAGVPARVVTGYQGGERNPIDGYLIVRQAMAHAWAEVYLAPDGWVRVDPTAVIPPDRVEDMPDRERFSTTLIQTDGRWLAGIWQRLGFCWDAVNNAWNQWVLGYDNQRQERVLRWLRLLDFGWQGVVLALTAAIAAMLAGLSFLLLRPGRGGGDPVQRLYRRYCQRLGRVGLVRAPTEGPADFSARVAARRPDLGEPAAAITGLYIGLRYGAADPVRGLAALRQAIRRFHPRRTPAA